VVLCLVGEVDAPVVEAFTARGRNPIPVEDGSERPETRPPGPVGSIVLR
jgi:hypothetical protein